jgi:glyoxylase-like metal-dependent hydrolase (beta-lactamase superfamily II)
MATKESNFQSNQLIMILALVASSFLLVSLLISPIEGRISSQQRVFAQEITTLSSSNDLNETDSNAAFLQVRNYTSPPPGPVNSWIIESTNGVVVIDAQRQLSEGANVLKEIKKLNKPIVGVIITHPHPDHINGLEALLNETTDDVPIYSTQSTFDIMKNDTGGLIALSKKILGSDYSNQTVLPNTIVKSGGNIAIDGITYHFEDIGPGEAGDMTLIYIPSHGLLFTGDVVNNRMHPFLGEGRSSEWIGQIEYIKQKYSDAVILFPGHSQRGSPTTLLDEQLKYINTFRSLVERQMQSAAAGGEGAENIITEEGKAIIKDELQRLYPGYIPVATLTNMLDINIDTIAKELSQEK